METCTCSGLSLCWSRKKDRPRGSIATELTSVYISTKLSTFVQFGKTQKVHKDFEKWTKISSKWSKFRLIPEYHMKERLKTAEQRLDSWKKHWDYRLQKARHNLSSETNWSEGLLKQIYLSREDSWQAKPHGPGPTLCQSG